MVLILCRCFVFYFGGLCTSSYARSPRWNIFYAFILNVCQSTGLPQAWGDEPIGAYSTGGVVPNIAGNVFFHKGLFSDTLTPFLNNLGDEAYVAYANIDCDLYTSTLDILEALHGRIVAGTILVFDEYICHPTWRQDEFRAWRESCKRFGWKYEYLGFSLSSKQAVVRVTGV